RRALARRGPYSESARLRPRAEPLVLLPLPRPERRDLARRPHADASRRSRRALRTGSLFLLKPAVWLVQRLWSCSRASRPRPHRPPRRLSLRVSARQISGGRRGASRPTDRSGERDRSPRGLSLAPPRLSPPPRPSP